MNLRTIVWKELWERPTAMMTSMLAILLGVAALVAIRHITVFSEQEVERQLGSLGANILVLPSGASLQDYYAADQNGHTIPEECVADIMLSGLAGVEKVSPRLCVPAQIDGKQVNLTGILPQSELHAMATWQTVNLFDNKHAGCKKADSGPTAEDKTPDALTTRRAIEELGDHELVVGHEISQRLGLQAGSSVTILGEKFRVLALLAPSGTMDDTRVFAHLHTVQKLAKSGEVVSVIEVMGCCEDAAGQLTTELGKLLPDSRIVTISQVVQTQLGVNRLMARSSVFVLGVLVLVGGATVASAISSNVRERRREIGTLMALGTTPGLIARLFLLKATWLGLVGGLGGCVVGIGIAIFLGPAWAGVDVSPLPGLSVVAVAAALATTWAAAFWPSRQAAQLDPCTCFREV